MVSVFGNESRSTQVKKKHIYEGWKQVLQTASWRNLKEISCCGHIDSYTARNRLSSYWIPKSGIRKNQTSKAKGDENNYWSFQFHRIWSVFRYIIHIVLSMLILTRCIPSTTGVKCFPIMSTLISSKPSWAIRRWLNWCRDLMYVPLAEYMTREM